MKVIAIFGVALRSLRRAPVRSALTALGVIVGVAAVVTTTSIGSGAKAKIQESLAKPESRTVFLMATVVPSGARSAFARLSPADRLNPEDYYTIRRSIPNVAAASPRIYLAAAHAKGNGRSVEVVIEGLDIGGFTTVPRRLLAGTLFSKIDVQHAANVCVISEALASTLFPGDLGAGRSIQINNVSFTVVGIVDDVEDFSSPMFRVRDLHIYIPFTSLLRRLDVSAEMNIAVQASGIEHVGRLQQDIGDLMEQRRSGRKGAFLTSNAFESIKTYSEGSLTVARLLAAVGAISLAVGGIGIMNIMLVSVTERTREIGIRMAVGTRCRDILSQFLTEAIALSLLGGTVGVAIGVTASWLVTRFNEWPTTVTPVSIISAFFCSVAVGVLFGYQPARRAALLRPVEALWSAQ